MQNPINKEKSIETCNIKYGCDSNMGDEEIFNKQRKSALKLKQYKDIFYQGTYELDFLEKYYHLGIVRGFPIKYGNKTYHPDFYLKDFDLVIEIKSTYWFNKHKELCLEKEKYTKLNHNYIIILDKNYEEFETIIKNPN